MRDRRLSFWLVINATKKKTKCTNFKEDKMVMNGLFTLNLRNCLQKVTCYKKINFIHFNGCVMSNQNL